MENRIDILKGTAPGKIIERDLGKRHISQITLAERAGVTKQMINAIIAGRRDLSVELSLRIEKAKRLLSTGLYTASAVCEMIGYENYPYFSSLLKKGRNFTQQILREFEKEAFIKNR